MKITDLNFDCLQRCLQHLNIEELLNIADSNKQLKYVARYIYARKYKGQAISLFGMKCKISENITFLRLRNIWLIVSLKWSLQFLRCFGDLAPDIEINFYTNYNYIIHLEICLMVLI